MENTQPPMHEDDVFSSRDSTTASQKASSSRIHFPPHDPMQNRPRPAQKTHSGLTPPVRRGSPLNPQNANQNSDSRRRPWPADAVVSSSDSSPRQRRGNSHNLAAMARIADSGAAEDPDAELEVGVFSNEYDLAHEDPRILQDVQRALKLKARREARIRRESVTPEKKVPQHSSPSSSHTESPSKLAFPTSFSPSPSYSTGSHRKSSNSTSSDVDFSPSTGIFDQQSKLHPVPTSLDSGTSLDWTGGSYHEGERKWTKSIVRKKEKDLLPPLGVMIDQQEKMHKEKLVRINNFASAQTTRKAHITSEQLSRQYNLIYESISDKKLPFTLTKVTRWYSSQPEVVRKTLEREEPFTWLKHLDQRPGKSGNSPWNLSALIMEEYVQVQDHDRRMQTIPENSALASPKVPYQRKSRSPSLFSSSRAVPDDRISFEPLAESKRSSWDAISLRSVESGSIRSGTSIALAVPPISPSSSRQSESTRNPKGYSTSPPEQAQSPESDGSESSDDEPPSRLQVATNLTVPELAIHPPSAEGESTKMGPAPVSHTSSNSSNSAPQKPLTSPVNNRSLVSLRTSLKPKKKSSVPNIHPPARRGKKYREEREEKLRQEYEAKSLVLAEAVHHNSKIRQLLNRISTAMKDYDSLQNLTAENIRMVLPNVPKDVVESFGHDPAGVTGATRRLQGWHAVEDIYQRVHRQRRTFLSFLESYEEQPPIDDCALDGSIELLMEFLEALKAEKAEIDGDAESVAELLKSVQEIQGEVKEEYNKTVSHASVVYPQLSHIVALEESYKDQYQQFWELGMDALTLLLDTVTPFWRTYGKTIGEDVRDFLIIPLYRNEFTGETKRYRIKVLPRRSLRHWFGLWLFFLASIAVNILQIRAAISSSMHFRLTLIPYDGVRWTALPFFWISIIIQWLAVIFEFAIVFMELGVIAWWSGWTIKLVS